MYTDSISALCAAMERSGIPPQRLRRDAPMRSYTSFRIGGPADLLLETGDPEEIRRSILLCGELQIPLTLIGNGSNLLVRESGIRGLVLRVAGQSAEPSILEETGGCTRLSVSAAVTLAQLAAYACARGLAGLAELSGIPGTLGGGAIMNAGAYGGELAQVITRVEALSLATGSPHIYEGSSLGFSYRHSAMAEDGVAVIRTELLLPHEHPEMIRARMNELAAQRREKQPLEYPSAGSTFKRPQGAFAAKLIDDCGLRGLSVGGAQVSEKHAGFVINRGGATARDVLSLMALVQQRVQEATSFLLEPEIRILGEDRAPEGEPA